MRTSECPFAVLLVLVSFLGTAGCSKTQYIGKANGKRSSARGYLPVSLKTFQAREIDGWTSVSTSQKLFSTSRSLSFSGTCERGVFAVRLSYAGGASSAPADCSSGSFELSHAVLADGNVELNFEALNRDGTARADVLKFPVTIDTIPPSAPTITSNRGRALASLGDTVTIEGTYSSDTAELRASPVGTLTVHASQREFSYPVTLTLGQTATLRFVAVDEAGNESEETVYKVSYGTNLQVLADSTSSVYSGSPIIGAGVGGGSLESASGPVISASRSSAAGRLSMGSAQMTADIDGGGL